jgi:hypothetical protein
MKDIYKNPIFYYVLAPAVLALWPLLVWLVYLPRAGAAWQNEKTQYVKAQQLIEQILEIDPERLDFSDSKQSDSEFDYATAVEKIAGICKIPSTNYKLSSGIIITSGGQKSQNAKLVLKDVDITRFARFLSAIQLRWANLQCTQLKLTKKKGFPDMWDVDLGFKYYY